MVDWSSYLPSFNDLLDNNVTDSVIGVYTTPLSGYAWFLVIFATMVVTYLKTNSPAVTSIVGLLFIYLAKGFLGSIGDGVFYAMVCICIAMTIYEFWKGSS